MNGRLAARVFVLCLVWLLAWTPYAAMSLWVMFFDARGLSPTLGLIPTLCCKVSAGANAMLYGLRYNRYFIIVPPSDCVIIFGAVY